MDKTPAQLTDTAAEFVRAFNHATISTGQDDEDPAACGRCRRPFDPADTSFDGHARYRDTPWCRSCIDNCHEGSAEHVCLICVPERYQIGSAVVPVIEVEESGADSHGWDPDDPYGDVDTYEQREGR